MASNTIELPLFPLTVLFPGTVLPLHIFEPRYRQMIAACQSENKPLGIVLPRPESEFMRELPHAIGTMAEIHNLEQLEDGRYTLNAVGIKRFRILNENRDNAYISATVEPYEDVVASEPDLVSATQQARKMFEEYLAIVLQEVNEPDVQANLPDEAEYLSYFIASFLMNIEDEQKQHFLEMTSTYQRLREETTILRREVPFIRQILSKKISDDRTMLN
ncbi:MAG: LON peptidase substrate-binding domain-containing protein [Ktedonobacteraceae bacterium]